MVKGLVFSTSTASPLLKHCGVGCSGMWKTLREREIGVNYCESRNCRRQKEREKK